MHMLSCCCFCSGKFQSPRIEHLSSSPLLLKHLVCFPVSFSTSCFIPLLFQISPVIEEVKSISVNAWISPATFLLKYLTICISHCCIVGGNHGIDVRVLISQSNEWCEFPTYRCLKNASHIWVPQLLKIKPSSLLAGLALSPSSDELGILSIIFQVLFIVIMHFCVHLLYFLYLFSMVLSPPEHEVLKVSYRDRYLSVSSSVNNSFK